MIALEGIAKRWPGRVLFEDLSLRVGEGEIVLLSGPSGAGKTTLLRLIAGLERPDAGRILLRGETVSDPAHLVSPHRRRLGLAFQSALLWPHLTVRDHLDFPIAHRPRREREARVDELLAALRLENVAGARAEALSGGEACRVSLGRACAARPDVLLLDEPFAHMDEALAGITWEWLRGELAGRTCLLVTHDPLAEEFARRRLVLADRRLTERCYNPD